MESRVGRILVTGATGYLGARICCYLRDSGFKVYGLYRTELNNLENIFTGIELIKGDLTDRGIYDKLLSLPLDAVLHTVSLDHKQSETYNIYDVSNTNVNPVWYLMDEFSKTSIKSFIYLSTIQVLGSLPEQVIDETYVGSPLNKYGLTHLMGEKICEYYSKKTDIKYISLRLSNGFGSPVFKENNWSWLVINDLCRMAYYEKKIVLQSNGTAIRDFIHNSDISKAIKHVIENSEFVESGVYNLTSGKMISLLEIAHVIKMVYFKIFNELIPVFHSNNILSENSIPYNLLTAVKNEKLLTTGFQLETSLESGIKEIFNYFQIN